LLNEELSNKFLNHLVAFLGLPSYGDSEETGPQKKISENRESKDVTLFDILGKFINLVEWAVSNNLPSN
jgi:hypothetical protein